MVIKPLLRAAYRAAFRAQCVRAMHEVARSADVPAPLRDAVLAAANGDLPSDEQALLHPIEELRARLEACPDDMEVLDFGAGPVEGRRTEEEMKRGVIVHVTVAHGARASKDPLWGTFLYMLVRRYNCKRGLELGSALGISAAYQAIAMKLNGDGHLITCEGAPAVADFARRNLRELGVDNVEVVTGKFADTLPQLCADRGPFDYVFIDGHHDEQATIAYFDAILPHVTDDAVIVFDDIEWSRGMRSAWSRIQQNACIGAGVGLRQLGVCVLDKDRTRAFATASR